MLCAWAWLAGRHRFPCLCRLGHVSIVQGCMHSKKDRVCLCVLPPSVLPASVAALLLISIRPTKEPLLETCMCADAGAGGRESGGCGRALPADRGPGNAGGGAGNAAAAAADSIGGEGPGLAQRLELQHAPRSSLLCQHTEPCCSAPALGLRWLCKQRQNSAACVCLPLCTCCSCCQRPGKRLAGNHVLC